MHQLILITAMSATTGLFGGKHCGKPHHGKKAVVASSCYSATPCGVSSYAPALSMPTMAASTPSYSASPQNMPTPSGGAVPAAPALMAPAPPAPSPTPSPSSPPPGGE